MAHLRRARDAAKAAGLVEHPLGHAGPGPARDDDLQYILV